MDSTPHMDLIDKKLLDIIQTAFPLTPRPYAVLGKELHLTEAETLARVRALRGRGIIRRLGANFNSAAFGYASSLCAAKVPETKIKAFVANVNAQPGVTHNYLRDNAYNVWFTVIAPSREHIRRILSAISEKTGVPILDLPAAKLYKIRVNFHMER